MEHYVNIMLDSGFKAVFGDKQVVMDFINAALYDEREVMRFLLYLLYDLPSRREGPGVEIRPAPGIWNLPFELQPSRVPFMANGRGSGKRANRSDFWADSAVIAQSTGFSLEEVNDLENLIRKEEIKN